MIAAVDYPRLGPLLATAFDKAVRVTLRSWVWLVVFTALCFLAASAQNEGLADNLATFVWTFVAAANAVRAFRPDYRMSGGTAGRIFLAGLGAELLTALGLLALIWPGIYLATKFSMAQAAVVFDDFPAEAALRRSWQLTTGRFWRTLLFDFLMFLAIAAVIAFSEVLVGLAAGLLVAGHLLAGTVDQAAQYGSALIFSIGAYAIQAGWLAGLYWYQGLKAMEQATATATISPAPAN